MQDSSDPMCSLSLPSVTFLSASFSSNSNLVCSFLFALKLTLAESPKRLVRSTSNSELEDDSRVLVASYLMVDLDLVKETCFLSFFPFNDKDKSEDNENKDEDAFPATQYFLHFTTA